MSLPHFRLLFALLMSLMSFVSWCQFAMLIYANNLQLCIIYFKICPQNAIYKLFYLNFLFKLPTLQVPNLSHLLCWIYSLDRFQAKYWRDVLSISVTEKTSSLAINSSALLHLTLVSTQSQMACCWFCKIARCLFIFPKMPVLGKFDICPKLSISYAVFVMPI